MSNNFVGMDCCVYCNEAKGVLIHKRFKDIPKRSYSSPEPCDKCKEKFKKDGVVPMHEIIVGSQGNITGLTGKYVFVNRESVQGEEFKKMMDEKDFLLCNQEAFENLTKGANCA